jgi:hypothetical protein
MKGREGKEPNLGRDFSIQPIDIHAAWTQLQPAHAADKALMTSWDGCEVYFQRSLARLALLRKAFESPAKELGPQIVQRATGFAADLMTLVKGQKEAIAAFASDLWTLRLLTGRNWAKGQPLATFRAVHGEAGAVHYEAAQLLLLAGTLGGEEEGVRMERAVGGVVRKCEEVKALLSPFLSSPSIPELPERRLEGRAETERALGLLRDAKGLLASVESSSVMGKALRRLGQRIKDFLDLDRESGEEGREGGVEERRRVEGRADKLLASLLLTFQRLAEGEGGAEEECLPKGLLPEMRAFDLREVVEGLAGLLRGLGKSGEVRGLFEGLVPFLDQYALLAQLYLKRLVRIHRGTAKLLSVLAGLFATLGAKVGLPSQLKVGSPF